MNALCQVWEKLIQSFWRLIKKYIHTQLEFGQIFIRNSAQAGKLTRTDLLQGNPKKLAQQALMRTHVFKKISENSTNYLKTTKICHDHNSEWHNPGYEG